MAGIPVLIPVPPPPFDTKCAPVRDFIKTHFRASYAGIAFDMNRDAKVGGRRVQIHEYPDRDWWDNEDLGRATQTLSVDGFVDGPYVEARSERLIEACSDGGPHLLTLPFRRPHLARCLTCTSTSDAQKQGMIEFHMEFVLEPLFPGGYWPFKTAQQQAVSDRVKDGLLVLGGLFGKRFSVLARRSKAARVPAVARDAAAASIASAGLTLTNALNLISISDKKCATAVNRHARFIKDNAMALAYQAEKADRVDDAVFVRDQHPVDAEFATRWMSLLTTVYRGANSADGVTAAGQMLAAYERPETTPGPTCQSVRMEAALADEVASLVRKSGLLVYAQGVTRKGFVNREDAIAARAELAASFQAEIERPPLVEIRGVGDQEIEEALTATRNAAVLVLSSIGAELPTVLRISTNTPLPAAVVATMIYNDCAWDSELVARNKARHPNFLPYQLEALRPDRAT
jgi:prophage DNA circulation protein